MNKSTDTETASPKSSIADEMLERMREYRKTPEHKKVWEDHYKRIEELRSEGLTETEILYEIAEL